MFVRAYSGWSLGCGLVQPEILFAWAKRCGVSAVCAADFDNLYGAISFYDAARRQGVRPIVAAVVTAAGDDASTMSQKSIFPDGVAGASGQEASDREMLDDAAEILSGRTKPVVRRLHGPRVVAIACQPVGYENLCKLVTARHMLRWFDLVEAASRYQEGLVYLASDPALLGRLAARIEPGRLFAEICDYGDPAGRDHNYNLMKFASQVGVEPVASHAAFFAQPEDWHLHRVLRAVSLNQPVDRMSPGDLAHKGAYLPPAELLRDRLREYGQALYNADRLLERCDLSLPLGIPHFPKVSLPAGHTACARLCRLVWEGLARRYGRIPREAAPRLEHELRIITKMGFADYFLVVHEIVEFAKGKGIGCVGRGSAADSLVTYCLGISDVDPLWYKLHFERFLNESRTDYPDIDLDIDWRRRDEVIRFVYDHWGRRHVAMISTQQYYRARSAFRDAARAVGMPTKKLNDLTGRLPYDDPEHLREAIATMPECRHFPMHDDQVARAVAIAEKLSGLPRGLSVHVGGVVISQREITCHTPLQPATKGIAISQYDLHAIERVGLVKIDLLGHRSLAILADTRELVRRNHGLTVDPRTLPQDDPETARILTTGRTVGCFQIESPGVRQLLQMLRAKDMRDVIHALSLIRPGPAASGMKECFIRRKLGLEAVTYLHPAMQEALGDTYGVMLFQEDVMRVAAAVAGFTMATGDSLRKALAQRDSGEYLDNLKRQFMAGASKRGCGDQVAEQIWLLVSNFAAYAYNKAHACTYGKISYWCTYMKAHWPAEFLTSVLNNVGGYYSLVEYLEEARRLGVRILPVDVNRSTLEYTTEPVAVQRVLGRRVWRTDCAQPAELETRQSGGTIQPETGLVPRQVGIRVPLGQVRNLGDKTAGEIVRRRREGAFIGLEDLLRRVRMSIVEARALILAGACDGLGTDRSEMVWRATMWRSSTRCASRRVVSVGGGEKDLLLPGCLVDGYSKKQQMALERQYLGFSPGDHPMAAWQDDLAGQNIVRSVDLPGLIGRAVTVAGIVVATRRAVTKSKEWMQFVSLEDRFGLMEVVLFPNVYQRFGGVFRGFGPYRVWGMVQENLGSVVLVGRNVRILAKRETVFGIRDNTEGHTLVSAATDRVSSRQQLRLIT